MCLKMNWSLTGLLTERGFGDAGAVPAGYGGLDAVEVWQGLPYRIAAPVAGDREPLKCGGKCSSQGFQLVKALRLSRKKMI